MCNFYMVADSNGGMKDIQVSMDKHQSEIRQAKLKSQEYNSRLRDLTIAIRYGGWDLYRINIYM